MGRTPLTETAENVIGEATIGDSVWATSALVDAFAENKQTFLNLIFTAQSKASICFGRVLIRGKRYGGFQRARSGQTNRDGKSASSAPFWPPGVGKHCR